MSDKPSVKTVYHPDFPETSYDVPTSEADAWKESGWRFTRAQAAEAKRTEAPVVVDKTADTSKKA